MRNSEGLNTSAIWGFTKFLKDILDREKPQYLGVAFDPKGGSFRNKIYSLYKANRSETPEDIILSVPYIKQILSALNIPILEVSGYEADDVIGTMAKRAARAGLDVYMVTPDKDYGQLIEENIKMFKPRKGGEITYEVVTQEDICKRYTIDSPQKVIDILALWGDVADNVPGVPGIGEKTAMKLVSTYGDIDGIYENIDSLKGKQKENLIENKDNLMLARTLVTIDQNVPVECAIEDLQVSKPDYCTLMSLFQKLNFVTMLRDLEKECGSEAKPLQEYSIDEGLFSQQPIAKSKSPEIVETPKPQSGVMVDMFETQEFENIKNIDTVPHIYTLIETQDEADKLASLIELKGNFCFDTETTGLNPNLDTLVGISIALEAHKAYYLPNNGKIDFDKRFKAIFESEKISKIGQNIKFDMLVLKNIGIDVKGKLYDTMILQYLLNPDLSNGMDYMALTHLNYTTIKIEDLIGKGAKQLKMDSVPIGKVLDYAAEDADITYQLNEILWAKIKSEGLEKLYFDIEEPLIKVLTQMEFDGVMIDSNILGEYAVLLEKEIEGIELEIRKYAGDDLNINSPKQLGELLFERLKITDKPKRTKTKQYKTDEEYLMSLSDNHPIVGLILEYRGLKKLLSTYVLSLPELINPKTGRVHTTYNQALTRTGRLSSNNPNLQNIPIRTPRGEKIRMAFVAQNSDNVIVAADYSQVELRIMAHLSGDKSMIEAFNSGEDIHAATAAKIFKKNIAEVEKNERSKAKSANFGIIYGISSFGLATNLKISTKEAKMLIDGYFDSYPQVKTYMDEAVKEVREKGYAETIYHRRRYLSDIHSQNSVVRSFAERNAINAPIQGSAADIIKLAMVKLYKELSERGLKAKMVLQVHDELVLEVPKTELVELMSIVKNSMENVVSLQVPLTADVRYAGNWLDAH